MKQVPGHAELRLIMLAITSPRLPFEGADDGRVNHVPIGKRPGSTSVSLGLGFFLTIWKK
jgi:hypothetical protein